MRDRPWILKTGSAVPEVVARRGDFEGWIAAGLGVAVESLGVCDVASGDALPEVASVSAVVITGSPAFVSEREPWSVASEGWVRELVGRDVPMLGICYGHQLIAQALGGAVGRNPRGRQMGTVAVDLSGAESASDPLLGEHAPAAPLQTTHLESVLELPADAVRLASTPLDPNHAFRLGDRTWGVQFHPEFDADIMRGYLDARAGVLREEGADPAALRRAVEETPAGTAILARFAEMFGIV